MANITHTSTGATNTPRLLEVIGVLTGLPMADLIMLINEASMAAYAAGDPITTLPNQHIDPNVSDLTHMGLLASSGVYPIISNETLNEKKIAKFSESWVGSPSFYETQCTLNKTSSSTGLTITGNTISALIKADKSYWTRNGSHWKTACPYFPVGVVHYRRGGGEIPSYISGCFAGATWVSQYGEPFTNTHNWGIYTNEASDITVNGYNLGTANPSLDGAWHHVLFVDQFTPTSIAKIYIDGELVFSLETNQYTDYIGISRIQFGNKESNPLSGVWAGDLAHFAAWARALDADEIARTYNFLKDEYGLT